MNEESAVASFKTEVIWHCWFANRNGV